MLKLIRFFLLFLGLILPFQGFALMEESAHVKVELIQEEETIQPNRPFWVALRLTIEEGWHVYWKNPGVAGMPLQVEWKLPPGFEAGQLQWPFPEKFTVAEMVGFGYEGEVTLLSQVTPPAQLEPHAQVNMQAEINWLVCSSSTCQPGSTTVQLPLAVASQPPRLKGDVTALFEQARAKMPQTHVKVKTVRKHGIVQLEVPQESSNVKEESIRTVYFFPEEQDVIDPSIEPTVAVSQTDTNRYLVNLKGSDEMGAQSRILKGVLVVHTQDAGQENFQAFDINSPIEEDKETSLIGLLDPQERTAVVGKGHQSVEVSSNLATSSFAFDGGLGLALLFAFLGGLLLNLMPCVLPVVSFKVMSFVKMAGQSRSLTFRHGVMFSVGVMISFWILASIMLTLRAYGEAVGWGFQLQEPFFVVILASILFIFALSLFNVFEWGVFFSSWAGQTEADTKQKMGGYVSSFFSGVLATAVATPCTGPFLGSAVGFAVTLPIWQALLIFTSLGLGMCFPYLLLAAFPSYLRFIPKPGAWMEIFKQLMGFILLVTVLWLLWVFSAQTDTFSLICLLAGFLCFAFGAWIYGQGSTPLVSRSKRAFAYVLVIGFFFLGYQAIALPSVTWGKEETMSKSSGTVDGWEEFSPERVAQLRREGKPVLIDFTAKWCLICQANHMVLASKEVDKQLKELGVVKMKADWTKKDPVITKELSKFGRNSVPLYVFYSAQDDQEPTILPQVLTPDVVIDHLQSKSEAKEIALKL